MALCENCGVDLDEGLLICPLCGKNQVNNNDEEPPSFNYPSEILRLQKKENRKYLWELSGIITFSGIAVCTIVDLLINKRLNWSLLSDVSVLAAWVILTLFLFAYKRTLLIVPGLLFIILTSLFMIDLIIPGKKWFFPVGFPLTIAAFFVGGIVIVLYRAAHLKGFNVLAAAIIILSGFNILTELILDKYLNGIVHLRWSLIVAISILPVALILFFYHYRLKRGKRLDSYFHI